MNDAEKIKLELATLDQKMEDAVCRIERDSQITLLSHDVGASDADFENFMSDISVAILDLCGNKRDAILKRLARAEEVK